MQQNNVVYCDLCHRIVVSDPHKFEEKEGHAYCIDLFKTEHTVENLT